ncbi:ATPase family AAA domain-containing protein 1 [Trichoderma ghanense]|uniref:ATPase family AAA domain-containing protein 1 n=1 Tax=Trichoderma ghanense TaxID=65468 RepID=A0ABY2GYS9_9HYPO
MQTAGILPMVALTVRLSSRIPRALHTSAVHLNSRSGGNGAKPAEDATDQHDEVENQPGTETSGGRLRGHATNSIRTRFQRRRQVSALPPVELPQSFLRNNVTLHASQEQPRLPIALAEDSRHPKLSPLSVDQGPSLRQKSEALELYFETALRHLLARGRELAIDLENSRLDKGDRRWESPETIARAVRVWDMAIDSARHLIDAIYPVRQQSEHFYKVRPFWWSQVPRLLNCGLPSHRDQLSSLVASLDDQLDFAERYEYPLPHVIADLSVETFVALRKLINRELLASPPPTFDHKTSKRPITILALSGYGGRSISEAIGKHFAHSSGADLVYLDAYDVSELVGGYLGQNWAYSRGPLAMLGFRAAELNGKIAGGRDERPVEGQDDDEIDTDVGISASNTSPSTVVEELQKLRQGEYESFSKWENLKIDKILDQIIRSTSPESSESHTRPVLIHLHDIIELSMTIEGSLLINRLRALTDIAWQQGLPVAILGTSSCDQQSEEYQNAIKEFAVNDFVVTRHIQPDYVERYTALKGHTQTQAPFHLQKADYCVENVSNVTRMLRALDHESPQVPGLLMDAILSYMRSSDPKFSILQNSILPAPEIYHLACAFKSQEGEAGVNNIPAGLEERFTLGHLQQWHGHNVFGEDRGEGDALNGISSAGEDPNTFEARATPKLNEYEKRVASGQINRENLRITFADVHAPPETISALKLLTSLSLVRPDAFSYGVLAQDKISGCLLYGPPGTGKTMLAKAVAKESGANMLEISGASINDKWVGESEKLIRAVFTLAKKLTPCVVFIDEADSLLASRSMFTNRASHREHINQFLKEWDGMEETNAFIMVATNRPFDLDDAVLRRLPRKIHVDLPLEKDRLAILKLLLKGEILDDSVSLDEYAQRTPYYSGSDLKNMCVAAAMAAVEEENEAAAKHEGPHPFQYPERRILRKSHFEKALKNIPASISEDMISLKLIRKFDEEYGNRKRSATKSSMGFGLVEDKHHIK